MRTRVVSPEDRPAIQALIERFGDFGLTHDWDDRVFAFLVAEDDSGEIVGAATLRWQAECFMALDPSASVRRRFSAARALLDGGTRFARRLGVREIYAFIPRVFDTWARALERFVGVRKDERQHLVISVAARSGVTQSSPDLWKAA